MNAFAPDLCERVRFGKDLVMCVSVEVGQYCLLSLDFFLSSLSQCSPALFIHFGN